jgi:hypothetical protein
MKNTRFVRRAVALASVAAMGLSACGGGGGGGGPALLSITTNNQDVVSHATGAGIFAMEVALGTPNMIPLASAKAHPAAWAGQANSLLQRFAGGDAKMRPQAATACGVSGTWSETFVDADNSGTLSVGDVDTMFYNNCVNVPGETLDGSIALTIVGIGSTSVNFQADLAHYSDATANHSLAFDGSYLIGLSTPSGSSSVLNWAMTAKGPVTVTVHTHAPFNDTVTLADGFTVNRSEDTLQSVTTVSGTMASQLAGGRVQVSTMSGSPLVKANADSYPSSGTVQVKGTGSMLLLTAMPAGSVQVGLDWNGDNVVESTTTQTWDWLF